jgi:uncharacterized membrane protein YkoI
MKLKRTYRDALIIVGVAFVLSVGGVSAWRRVAPPTDAAPRKRTSKPPAPKPQSKKVASTEASKGQLHNELIARRNLFRPLVAPKAETPPRAAPPSSNPRPTFPSTPFPTPRPMVTQNAAQNQVAVVGTVRIGKDTFALVEDLTRGESRLVREGESAFGYRVARVNDETATLERDGDTLHLALGENKSQRGGVRFAGGIAPNIASNPASNAANSSQTALAQLPPNLQATVKQLMPPGSDLRVRMDTQNGELVYRVNQRVNGLDYSLRLAPDGRVLRMSNEVRNADLPAAVMSAANSALEGYTVNMNDTPRLEMRDGRTYYQIEVRAANGRNVDLLVAPDGTVIGRD